MFTHGLQDGLKLEYFQVGLGKETYADRDVERKAVGLSKLPIIFTSPCGSNRLRFVTEQNEQPYYQLVSALGYELCTIHKFTSVLEL